MKKQGIHKRIKIDTSEIEGLTSSQIAKKYGISRITAWRIKNGKQNFCLIPKEKEMNLDFSDPQIIKLSGKFEDIIRSLHKSYSEISIEKVKDIVADRRLYILENISSFSGKKLTGVLYNYSRLDIISYL